jgi:hypothetical protein
VHSNTFAENLLALFTTREVAASIVGDLIEQAHFRARGWFACEVIRLAFALCFGALVSAPGRTLRLAGLGFAVFVAAYLILFIASGLPWYPWHRVGTTDFWVRVAAVAFVSNLTTGAILARRRSSGNVSAVGPLTAVWFAAWLIQSLFVWAVYPWPASELYRGATPPWLWPLAWTPLIFPFLYLVPLLLGAAIGQRRIARVIE